MNSSNLLYEFMVMQIKFIVFVVLQRITKNNDGADLGRALQKARELFEIAALSRPGAKRILVVAMDKMSDSDEVVVSVAARSLAQDGVRVIAVTFGKEADPQEIVKATLNENNVIETDGSDSAKDIAAEVIEKADNGKKRRYCVVPLM